MVKEHIVLSEIQLRTTGRHLSMASHPTPITCQSLVIGAAVVIQGFPWKLQ